MSAPKYAVLLLLTLWLCAVLVAGQVLRDERALDGDGLGYRDGKTRAPELPADAYLLRYEQSTVREWRGL